MQSSTALFKRSSTTYYYSTLFFPPAARTDVTALYGFVRTADDLVDTMPQNAEGFFEFRTQTARALAGNHVPLEVINAFASLVAKRTISHEWIHAFLDTMEADLTKKIYRTFHELEKYMYGSAEVIGLMMCRILELPMASYQYAQLQGKAMQMLNFIRDVEEDNGLGRQYIPLEDIQNAHLENMKIPPPSQGDAMKSLIRQQIMRYRTIQNQAFEGFHFIPRRHRIPIKTAADLYLWTSDQIYQDPLIVYRRKVKPGKGYVISRLLRNSISL